VAKKITLSTPHTQAPPVTEYILKRMLVEYDDDKVAIELESNDGQKFKVVVNSIPATTKEQAIIALINNGILAGTIGDA